MQSVEIYTTPTSGYCAAANRLLQSKGVAYSEIDVSRDPGLRQVMRERAKGRWTVPQIFIGGQPIGGCDELHMLEYEGRLDPMLEG